MTNVASTGRNRSPSGQYPQTFVSDIYCRVDVPIVVTPLATALSSIGIGPTAFAAKSGASESRVRRWTSGVDPTPTCVLDYAQMIAKYMARQPPPDWRKREVGGGRKAAEYPRLVDRREWRE